jgi:hypothetical protein
LTNAPFLCRNIPWPALFATLDTYNFLLFQGALIHSELADSVDDCLGKCKSTDGCQWFSYVSASSLCFLLKDCPALDETVEGSTSGQVDCELSPAGNTLFNYILKGCSS